MLCLNSTGTCVASENEASWYVEPCECTEGWTGDLCDEDIDGCAENPCFSLCTDVVASKVLFIQCSPLDSNSQGPTKFFLIMKCSNYEFALNTKRKYNGWAQQRP